MKILALLAIAAFFCLSVASSVQPDWFDFIYAIPGRDKSVHFVVGGVLSFLVVAGFSGTAWRGHTFGPLVWLALTVLLVTLDEITQIAIPSRTFALLDLGWSYAGVLLFGLAAILWLWVVRLSARN